MKVAFLSLTKNVGGAELSLMQILNSCNYSFVVYPSERGQFTQLLDEYNYKYTLFGLVDIYQIYHLNPTNYLPLCFCFYILYFV